MQNDFSRAVELDRQWDSIVARYRLAPLYAPLNFYSEKQATIEAYHAGESHCPRFQYLPTPELPTGSIQQFMIGLSPEKSFFENLFFKLAQQELLAIRTVQTRRPGDITGSTCLAYSLPDVGLLAEAELILSAPQFENGREYPAKSHDSAQAVQIMQDELIRFGIMGWTAQVCSPMNARVAVNAQDKLVKIREDATFTAADLRRLLVHEIGVHVNRAFNGQRQPLTIFARGLPGYLETEEGLAVYSEQQAGVLLTSTMRIYAARVLAASLAMRHSFCDVFKSIAPQVGADAAFEIVARAKRGFVDTAQPGAHTKDIIYLRGSLAISRHLMENPNDYKVLMAGKIGLQDIAWVSQFVDAGLLIIPESLSY